MKIKYIDRDFSVSSRAVIMQANAIIAEYRRAGFTLTLRQLYYQFVSRDLLANNDRNYDRLGSIINDARLAGLVSWKAIEDRTRNLRSLPVWKSPQALLRAAQDQFRVDKWATQKYRPEVWIEKDALMGVIEPTCNAWRVPYYACRGYNSQSEQWAAAQRVLSWMEKDQATVVFHLGDHDPSGIDMTRDMIDRFHLMGAKPYLVVKRLALNLDQVRKYKPPPNPAKLTDSRSGDYVQRFGNSSWELDALEPRVIAKLLEDHIRALIDPDAWDAAGALEEVGRGEIGEAIASMKFEEPEDTTPQPGDDDYEEEEDEEEEGDPWDKPED